MSSSKITVFGDSFGKTFKQGAGKTIAEAAALATLSGMSNMVTRRANWDTWVVSARCEKCGWIVDVTELSSRAIEDCMPGLLPVLIGGGIRYRMQKCIAGTCCDPLDQLVDGLTVRECLERYQDWQQEGARLLKDKPRVFIKRLTPAQLSAARSAWSSALRAKQAEARAEQRVCTYWEGNEDE